MIDNNLYPISTGESTYWRTDRRKTPDVIVFCVIKGISKYYFKTESHLDLTSDHIPIITKLTTTIIKKVKPTTLYNAKTNWNLYREILNKQINCKIPLKSNEEL